MQYYLYRHIRTDKEEVFYIGIGRKRLNRNLTNNYERAYSKANRNIIWKRITSKTDYEVEIMLESDNLKFIKDREIEFISLYGRKDLDKGTLCNLTKGGDGGFEWKPTKEQLLKMSESHKGKKNGFYGKQHSKETILKIKQNNSSKELGNNPSSKKVINIITKEIYSCAKEVALLLNMNIEVFRRKLRGESKNNTNYEYI